MKRRLHPFHSDCIGTGKVSSVALLEQRLEFAADRSGLASQFVQELALLVIDLAVGEDHLPKPGDRPGGVRPLAQYLRFVRIDLAGGQDLLFDLSQFRQCLIVLPLPLSLSESM